MREHPKKYVSVDVEANGDFPWFSSMLSIGACIVGDTKRQFYSELKPITREYILENFKIGARSLNSLRNYNHDKFNPEEILDILYDKGRSPQEAIPDFVDWVLKNTKGRNPIFVAAPIRFDARFVDYYISMFSIGENPFGSYKGDDINSFFRGSVRDENANIKDLNLRSNEPRHNALEDAVQQAKEFYIALVHMRQHK